MAQDNTPERPQRQKRDPMADQVERERQLIEATGAFVREWAHTEWGLFKLTSALLRIDYERGRFVWASATNFRAKRLLLSRVGEAFLVDKHLPRFRTIIAQAEHLSEKRNRLAHERAYYIGKGVFRFMNDETPTQPETFGRYTDIQVSNIKAWAKEAAALDSDVTSFSLSLELAGGSFVARARLLPEMS